MNFSNLMETLNPWGGLKRRRMNIWIFGKSFKMWLFWKLMMSLRAKRKSHLRNIQQQIVWQKLHFEKSTVVETYPDKQRIMNLMRFTFLWSDNSKSLLWTTGFRFFILQVLKVVNWQFFKEDKWWVWGQQLFVLR